MKFRVSLVALLLLLMLTTLTPAQGGQEFSDPDGKFKLQLVGDWRAVSYNDAVGRQKTEFVYRDRSEGLLKISRESLTNGSLNDFARQEEETLKIYRQGFQIIAKEPFTGGTLKGMLLSFYTTESGRNLAHAFYFLQEGNTVWVLRFSGKRGSLDINRNLTDQIARSFRTK